MAALSELRNPTTSLGKVFSLVLALLLFVFVSLSTISGFLLYQILRPARNPASFDLSVMMGHPSTFSFPIAGEAQREGWLFPGQDPARSISTRQLSRVVEAAAEAAGLTKHVSPHTLRHSFATHLLEDGVDIRVIQVLLGHAKLDNTALYARVATKTVRTVTSPLDKIMARVAQGDSPGASPSG